MSSLSKWSARRAIGGADYYPPEGESLGAIKVRQRIRPLEPVKRHVARTLANLSSIFESPRVEESDDLVTSEGEYASIVRIGGRSKVDGKPTEYILGFVFGDDFFDRFDAYCTEPGEFASFRITLRDVVFAHRLSLGRDRSRRYYYDPPPGWQGLARNLVAEWYPLDYPRHFSRIDVAPAIPESSPLALLEPLVLSFGRLAGLVLDEPVQTQRVTSTYGLSGELRIQKGHYVDAKPRERRGTLLHTVVFQDERFNYLMRMITTEENAEKDGKVFRDLLTSVRPLPHPIAREADLWSAWHKQT